MCSAPISQGFLRLTTTQYQFALLVHSSLPPFTGFSSGMFPKSLFSSFQQVISAVTICVVLRKGRTILNKSATHNLPHSHFTPTLSQQLSFLSLIISVQSVRQQDKQSTGEILTSSAPGSAAVSLLRVLSRLYLAAWWRGVTSSSPRLFTSVWQTRTASSQT